MLRLIPAGLLVLCSVHAVLAQARNAAHPGVEGYVQSLGSDFFVMDADGVDMKVYANINTVFRIEGIPASAAYVVKGTHVHAAGTSDRVGTMNAVLVTIVPSTESISGTVDKIESKFFILKNDKGDQTKVYVARFTKYVTGKTAAAGSQGKRADSSKLKVGAKVDITPVTNRAESVDAWIVNFSETK